MATVATLLVLMGMDTKGLVSGAAKADATLAGVGTSASKFGAIADKAFLGLGVAAVAGVAVAIKAGSDLNEQINKSGEVFEQASDSVIAFAKDAASSLGIAETDALSAASNFGQLFEAAGYVEKAAAGMSEKMVTLAADLGSFNNIPVPEALEKIRAGLAGQARPLREVGIFLSEAAIQAEAYSSGIAKQGAELTDAQKIQARYNLILDQSTKAQGDFQRTLGESLPNQIKVVSAEIKNLAADLGIKLLPVVLDMAKAFHLIVPVIGVLADNLGLIFGVLIGWGALKFLPTLLFAIGEGLEFIGATSIASGIGNTAGALAGLAGTATGLGYVAVAVGAVYLAMKIANDEAPTFAANLALVAAEIVHTNGGLPVLNENLAEMRLKANLADAGITSFNGAVEAARHHAIQTGQALSKMGKDIRDGIVDEIPGIIGSVTTLKETFSISPGELVKITGTWAEIAHRIAHDLRVIADSDLKPAMREAISALPPEMRDAWVHGNEQQRASIERSIRDTLSVQKTIPGLAKDALTGGTQVGGDLARGIAQGIRSNTAQITAAAEAAVDLAIRAARAAADATSPSKKMEELGHDMISGLVNGLIKNQNALLRAAEKVMSALQNKLSSMLSKASSFSQGIQGGFASLLSFPTELPEGVDLQSFFQTQVNTANQFAAILQALQAQGAGKALLSSIASQGTSAIPLAQELLQQGPEGIAQVNQAYNDIATMAANTADQLTNIFFGDRIDALRQDVKDQKDILIDIKQNVKYLEKISNQLDNGAGGNITINAGALLGTREEVLDWIRQGLVDSGRSGKGHH